MSTRRTVTSVTDEDADGSGAPRLYAYGRCWIASRAGRSARTVRDAIKAGEFDPADPVSTVRWIDRVRLVDEIACLAGVHHRAVLAAIKKRPVGFDGRPFDIHDPVSVIGWCLARRGEPAMATVLRHGPGTGMLEWATSTLPDVVRDWITDVLLD